MDNTKGKRPLCVEHSIAVTGQKKAEYQLSSSQQYIFKVLAVHMTLTLNCQGFDRQVLSWPMCTRLQILILVEEQVNKVNIPKPWQTAKINFFVKNKYLPLPKCLEAYAWIMSFQQVLEFWHWVEYQILCILKFLSTVEFFILGPFQAISNLISFELRHPLLVDCTPFRSNFEQLKTEKKTKVQLLTPSSRFNSLLK